MEPIDVAAKLLEAVAGDFYCESCLASTMHVPTAVATDLCTALAHRHHFKRREAACVACGRYAMATACIPVKCVRCSDVVEERDLLIERGETFHQHCWQIVQSNSRIADSRQMTRLSHELIRRSLQRILPAPDDSA